MQPYRVSDVAEMLGFHPNTVRKWVRTDVLHPVKLPGSHYNRFTAEEIDRLRSRMGLPDDNPVRLYRVGQAARMFGVRPIRSANGSEQRSYGPSSFPAVTTTASPSRN
jgi:uncharacterized protein YjcR